MKDFFSDKKKRNSALLSLAVNIGIVLLLFLLLWFPPKDAEAQEDAGGALIIFGYDESGMGDNPAEEVVTEEQPEESAEESVKDEIQPDPSPVANEEIITQENMESVEVESDREKKEEVVEEVKPEVSDDIRSKLDALKNMNSGSNANKGNDDEPGIKGSLNGLPEGDVYGENPGDYNIDIVGGFKRKVLYEPELSNETDFEGLVVVEFTFDRNGKVTRATISASKSKTSNPTLWAMATRHVMQIKFSPYHDGPETMKGVKRIDFRKN